MDSWMESDLKIDSITEEEKSGHPNEFLALKRKILLTKIYQ